jgi:hypothetical protein
MTATLFRNLVGGISVACAIGVGLMCAPAAAQSQSPVLIVLDRSAIDYGPAPHLMPADSVNESVAKTGLRDQLPYFAVRVGGTMTLRAGDAGSDGWFALRDVPASWANEDPAGDGLTNYLLAGPGLGSPNDAGDRAALLRTVPSVVPLRATGLSVLIGRKVCAIAYRDEVPLSSSPERHADLSGANLGVAAFVVRHVDGADGDSLSVTVEVLDAQQVCADSAVALPEAPDMP